MSLIRIFEIDRSESKRMGERTETTVGRRNDHGGAAWGPSQIESEPGEGRSFKGRGLDAARQRRDEQLRGVKPG